MKDNDDERFEYYINKTNPYQLGVEARKLAAKNKLEEIEKLIKACAEDTYKKQEIINNAASYFAFKKNNKGIKAMLKHGANAEYVAWGYGKRGAMGEVKKLVAQYPTNKQILNAAVNGIAGSKKSSLQKKLSVENLIDQGADPQYAIKGYLVNRDYDEIAELINNHIDRLDILHVINLLCFSHLFNKENESSRISFLGKVNSKFFKILLGFPHLMPEEYKKISNEINPLVLKYNLNYSQACQLIGKIEQRIKNDKLNFSQSSAYADPGLQVWLLQGLQLAEKGLLAPDMILSIACYVMPLDRKEMETVSTLLNTHRLSQSGFFKRQNDRLPQIEANESAPSFQFKQSN